ncbi:MAG: TRZ/ATZ family hydrolase [Methylomonas sp.]|nr:TRZ/ATZ family hydrolase [Methylomonas sp.]PPD22545.1 MAG: N-ethylammeline chlorohydrolase [Methylomonas sp.]PPD27857.1 MAG: N-ethylammeline chlorohydrolase [Methylomonas sp.]PPD39966.1 MAG: N-ethylammeline chlorohydrolase [Methylomonas sp.]PPD41054.1 MAG: N-ethylammeline chlorohydrolase [Methylomonas sp.]
MDVDLVIQPRWIIPVEPEQVLSDCSLVIHDGRIVDLLDHAAALHRYQPKSLQVLNRHALIPGFINCHTHAAMSLLSGIADDLALMDWLENHIWPAERTWMSEAFVRDGTDLAIAEMLRGGTTCFNDMYFFPDVAAQQAMAHGIRANIGLIVFDFPTLWAENADAYLAKGLALHEQLRHENLISLSFAPHAPYTVSDGPLRNVRTFADEMGLTIHMHVHETAHELRQQHQASGQTPLERLGELGMLDASFMAVHMTQLQDADIARYAATGGHIVHCPESNLKLASGFCPVAACLDAGINVALGTDGAASNNDLDMLAEMRTAALLAKGVSGRADAVPAMQALKMATINGARALGLDHEIGSLQIGKAADVVAIDLSDIETQPTFNPLAQIVYAASRHQVTDVWVAGRHVLNKRQLTTLDMDDLRRRAADWQTRLSR